ncbi:I17RC protein, partial [Podargus strigoides]|nr:I17RC protein [Podargus strigoides]
CMDRHPSPGATTDAEAWERLWARSRLVLHVEGQVLTCSLSAPCDLPAVLVPCWQPEPAGPCQALPDLQQPAVGQVSGAPWGAGGMGNVWVALTEHPFCPQGPQEFGGLRLHPNLCVQVGHPPAPRLPHGQPQALLTRSLGQVWSSGQVRLTQCLRDREYCEGERAGTAWVSGWGEPCPGSSHPQTPGTSPGALPGRPDDLLLLEHRGNASLCALERGACTPLASFTSMGAGHPGLLEQELQRDVAAGQCRQVSAGSWRAAGKDLAVCDMSLYPQVWHPENSTEVVLWVCPLHKYLRTRWVLAWMGVLLVAACLLLLLLVKKEDIKGEWCPPGGCALPGT